MKFDEVVKSWFRYSLNREKSEGMKFLYLRIGATGKMFDEISSVSSDLGINWEINEAPTFREYHFSSNLTDYDGILVNIDISDDLMSEIRKDFWENFIWKTEDKSMVTGVIIPDSNKIGSLTKSQVIEGLSLVRLTDRPFQLFETGMNDASEIVDWIVNMSIIAHRNERFEPETNEG